MTASPAPRVIAGRYEVRRLLGKGAFGEVHEVYDHYLDETCALKLLATTPFERWSEAQVLRQLHGEHILPILNADVAEGRAYVVTHLATHGTVAERITPNVGLDVSTAVRWARQSCQGVARMHDHRLLHCDIKPENLFLDDQGNVLVGDLGLAQSMDANGMAQAAGTPSTMAPEVARPAVLPTGDLRTYSARSDVYSLGATLYWMLAGEQPCPGVNSHAGVWYAQQPDLWDAAPHVPHGLRDIVNRAIDRDPDKRYPSPADLDAALGGRTLPARQWTRIIPHTGHVQCFVGDKPGATRLQVCATMTGRRTQVRVEARQAATGRVIKRASQTGPMSSLPAALRKTFKACE